MAPLDRRAQRLLPRVDAAAGLQHVEPAREAVEQLRGREHAHARGGELERERQLLEPRAERGDAVGGGERRIGGERAREEELDAFLRAQLGDGIGLLAGQAQHLAARHEHVQARARGEQRRDVVGRVGHVLEVVEHEQERAVGDVPGDVLLGAERLRDGRQDELRVVERRERHPEDAVREAVGRGARRLQREACLADAARAGERQQARLARAQEVGERVELAGAAEERRRGDGQVGAVEALAAAGTRRCRTGRSARARRGP